MSYKRLIQTDLYYYGYRFYHPTLMRWLNRDPIEEDGGINLYAFCGNNSLTTIDYLGTTKIGEILSSFFDKDLGPLLWIMYENDEYTAIVRDWEPVVKNVNIIKNIVYRNNDIWRKKHTTTKSWRPNMNGQFDPNKGYYHIETSPNGTDPDTAKTHFILYNLTFIQTKTLHTSAIGSFHIFATLDSIKNCTAQINIWMYNKMSRESFGKFAQHSYFSESYMHNQYMWWNWKEKVTIDKNWRIH